jgi:peptide/nickel transport system substrate-binding protein
MRLVDPTGTGKGFVRLSLWKTARPETGNPKRFRDLPPLLTTVLAVLIVLSWGVAGPVRAEGHGIAMHGTPDLSQRFAHLPYADPDAPKGGTAVFGEVGAFDSLHPFLLKGRSPWALRAYTYETLMARSWDEPFTLYGLLAETVETPPDRSWVRFTLNPAARFSDGSPVTVADVIWSLETLGTRGHPRYRNSWASVASVEQDGPRSLTIRFSEPNRELPLIMGLRPVLKRADWEGRDFDVAGLEAGIGSGPYVVGAVETGRTLELVRNPDWWGADLPVNRGLYNFDRLRFEYFRNGDALWSAVRTGAVSMFVDGDPVRWSEGYDFPAAEEGRVVRHEIAHGRPSGMEGFVMNSRRPVFADRRVRAAMALAFDWAWVNARLYGGAYQRIESYWDNSVLGYEGAAEGAEAALLAPFAADLPPGTLELGWRPPEGDGGRNRANLRAAGRLLDDAGWPVVSGGQRGRTGAPLAFEVLVQSDEHETLASLWADALARLGVGVTVRRVDQAQYEERRRTYDYDVTVNRWYLSLSPGTEQWLYFGSEGREQPGTRNYMGVAEPAVDAMIRALLAAQDESGFRAAVRALDRVLMSGIHVVPFGVLAGDRVAAQATLRRPPRDALYGYRPEVWWHEPSR